MPGAGKSTLGVVLAKKLGMSFVDCDLLIQEGYGCLLSDLLRERGVEGFLAVEDEVLAGLECEGHVIATGGSAVYGERAMAHLREMSTIVYLQISFEELCARLDEDLMARGVAMRNASTLRELYDERVPLYERWAHLTIDNSGNTTRESLAQILEALQ